MGFVFFLIRGFTRSTTGRGGNFFSSSRIAIAAFFFEIFLLFPSPSPTNSPTDTLVTKLFMWGGPVSRATCFRGKDWVKAWQDTYYKLQGTLVHTLLHMRDAGKGGLRTESITWREPKCQHKETAIMLNAFSYFSNFLMFGGLKYPKQGNIFCYHLPKK